MTSLLSLLIFSSISILAMRRALFTVEEVRLATERRLKYLGAAKVNIYQIQFDPPLPGTLIQRTCIGSVKSSVETAVAAWISTIMSLQ